VRHENYQICFGAAADGDAASNVYLMYFKSFCALFWLSLLLLK